MAGTREIFQSGDTPSSSACNGDARRIALAHGMPGSGASGGSTPVVVAGPRLLAGVGVEEDTAVSLGADSERSQE